MLSSPGCVHHTAEHDSFPFYTASFISKIDSHLRCNKADKWCLTVARCLSNDLSLLMARRKQILGKNNLNKVSDGISQC